MKRLLKYNLILMIVAAAVISGCKKDKDNDDDNKPAQPTPYEFKIPKGFPTNPNIPADNPLTVEGVKLGHYLYYDERMSGKADQGMGMSCSSCHIQKFAFENGVGKGTGTIGIQTTNVMLPHINLAWNPGTFGWNGSVPSIEEDVYGVIPSQAEFASNWDDVIKAISAVPEYPAMFEAAFGSKEITKERIAKAIAQFVRTLVSSDSKFDRYLRGEYNFTPSERNGLVLFTTEAGADCFHCHGAPANPLMTTHLFYNNAKDSVFDMKNDRYSVTHDSRDIGAYKATTLRNIEVTGPYMHDGRFKTLDEVIDFYSEGLVYSKYAHPLMHKVFPPYGHGAMLNPQQKADLKAFLLTLTDTTFLNNPAYGDPFKK
jgi:cytochrome c peroxidase